MKQRPESTDYLSAASGTSWADAQAIAGNPSLIAIGKDDLGDTDFIYAGKAYWVSSGPNWAIRHAYLEIDVPSWPLTGALADVYLRLYLADTPDLDFTVTLRVLAATYLPLDGNAWNASGTSHNTAIDVSEDIESDDNGNYIDIALDSDQIALLAPGNTAYVLIKGQNETSAPTDIAWLKAYSATYTTAALRPYLAMATLPQRQIITDALFDTLDTIDSFEGYHFDYPTVSRHWLTPDDLGETQCPAIMLSEEDDVREWGASKTDVATLEITLGLVVWNTDADERRIETNRAIDDIELCIDRNRKLGIAVSPYLLRGAMVSRVERDEDWQLDGCKQMAFVTVAIDYPRRHRG